MSSFEKLQANRTFSWHYDFPILIALSKASIHHLKQSCHLVEHLSMIIQFKTYGNERWTVNLVPARITRRAGAPALVEFLKFRDFSKFSKFWPNFELLEKLASDRTFSRHCHFSISLVLSKALIYYLKLLLYLISTSSKQTWSEITFSWSRALACAAPLWPA